MKKRFGMFALALVLVCSIVTSSAFAVSPVTGGELDEIEVTATTRVFYIDEEGNRVLVEEDTEFVDSILVERDSSGEGNRYSGILGRRSFRRNCLGLRPDL